MSSPDREEVRTEFETRDMLRRLELDTELRGLVTDGGLIRHISEIGGVEGHLPILWQRRFALWNLVREQIPALSLNAGGGVQVHRKFAGNIDLTIAQLLPLEGRTWRLPNGGVLPANEEDIRNLSDDFISKDGTAFVITTHEGRNTDLNAAMVGRMWASDYGREFLEQ